MNRTISTITKNANINRFVAQTNKIKVSIMKAKAKNEQLTNNPLFKNRRANNPIKNNHVVKREFSTFSNLPPPEDPNNLLFMAFVLGVCYIIVKR
jgi:hypothetical protein